MDWEEVSSMDWGGLSSMDWTNSWTGEGQGDVESTIKSVTIDRQLRSAGAEAAV